jgi:hypothetical protein
MLQKTGSVTAFSMVCYAQLLEYVSHNPQIITDDSLKIFILHNMVLASVAVVLSLISVVGISAQFLAIPIQNPR